MEIGRRLAIFNDLGWQNLWNPFQVELKSGRNPVRLATLIDLGGVLESRAIRVARLDST